MSDDDIRDIVHIPLSAPSYPMHAHAVERAVQLVSEAAEVIGVKARDD